MKLLLQMFDKIQMMINIMMIKNVHSKHPNIATENMCDVTRCAIWYQTLGKGILMIGQNAALTS